MTIPRSNIADGVVLYDWLVTDVVYTEYNTTENGNSAILKSKSEDEEEE